jgi:transcriptional regulator with XRE-family HTH domain
MTRPLDTGRRPTGPLTPLLRRRLALRLSQQAVADRVGISRRAYQRYERGQARPLRPVATAILDALGVPNVQRDRYFRPRPKLAA